MLEIHQRLGTHCHDPVDDTVTLTFEQRDRGRLKLISAKGVEVRVFLTRGKPLLVGEYLRSQCGKTLQVQGAVERVTRASCADWPSFARACYHLGNRHVRLQVGECWLRIQPDHVLEDMLRQLGLTVAEEEAVFVPESGAYNHGHSHQHEH